MRGRLRITSETIDGGGGGPNLPEGSEVPDYEVDSTYFTFKVNFEGQFDEKCERYIGGKIAYFDMCTPDKMTLSEIYAMLVQLRLEKGSLDLWLLIPEVNLSSDGLMPIETNHDVGMMMDLLIYTKLVVLYATSRQVVIDSFLQDMGIDDDDNNDEWFDFSFTQYAEDERERVIDEIREEVDCDLEDNMLEEHEAECNVEEDRLNFHGDTSNIDSSDAELLPSVKKKNRRARKPAVLDNDDHPPGMEEDLNRDGIYDSDDSYGAGGQNDAELMNEDAKLNEIGLDAESSEGIYDSDDERLALSSCDEQEIQYPEFNELTQMDDPQFSLGMLFTNGAVFRAAVRKHAIVHQRPIKLKKNLADKIKWVCIEGCNWKCYGIRQQRSSNIQIKTYLKVHTCNPAWKQKQLNSTWIAIAYEDEIRMNPTWPIEAFHSKVINDLKCHVSHSMIYRALRKAKENIKGKHEEEFKKLYKYGNELKKTMPTSNVKLMTEPAEIGVEGRRFKRFYVCLGPLKAGFMDGCRPLLGLDGCHLKGPFGGILLTAVATDPNDGMYPVAWAQVEAENNSSWDWFLSLLKDDLGMHNTGSYTFISDRQKGLVNALEKHFPESEHRFCVMHLWNNISKEYNGKGVRGQLWAAAKATTDYFYNMHMETLKKLSMKAYTWLDAKPRSQWSRSAFRDLCKSDVFVNNNCEIFNNAINKFRDMGIVTMFKAIHNSCMARIQMRKSSMERLNTKLCNRALQKLHKSMLNATKARPVWNGGDKYHVTMSAGGHEIVVDLKNRVCACRKWQLTGIPCFHATACILFQKQSPIHFIHKCHKRKRYLQVYSHFLEPINGEPFWEETLEIPPLPPKKRIAPGRPKKNRDKKSDVVHTRKNDPTMLKREGTSLQCSWCKAWGHNSRSCETKKSDTQRKDKEEGRLVHDAEVVTKKSKVKCSYCDGEGHNQRSCKKKKNDELMQEEEDVEAQLLRNEELLWKQQEEENSRLLQELQEEQPKKAHKMPNASPVIIEKPTKMMKPGTHGGIFRAFKPPGQQAHTGPLGVEFEDFNGQNGHTFTSLRKLEAAKLKKMGKMKQK